MMISPRSGSPVTKPTEFFCAALVAIASVMAASAFAADPARVPACRSSTRTETLRLGFLGDIYLSQRAENRLQAGTMPRLQETLSFLNKHTDILIGNLEGALTEHTVRAFPDQPFAHRMRPGLAMMLRSWGLHGVTLANNHSMDFGLRGLMDTQKTLAQAGLKHSGAGENLAAALAPMVFQQNGFTVHVLSFNATYPDAAWATNERPGVAYPELNRLRRRVAESAKTADLVVVAVHWGAEGQVALRDYQPVIADAAIEAGAAFVYGHHTHSVQPIQRKGAATVAYGLGNFVFDSYSSAANFGLAAVITLCKGASTLPSTPAQPPSALQLMVQFVPLNTNNFANHFATRIMTPSETAKASRDLKTSGQWPSDIEFLLPQGQL
jgi:poly-gamma-glutamate synthesis protein (capsule biosynthesis protein)